MKNLAISADRAPAAGEVDELGARVLAGLAAVLQRHTDRSELVLGYAGDDVPRLMQVRLDLGDDPTFTELVARARAAIHAAGGAEAEGVDCDATLGVGREPPAGARDSLWLAAHRSPEGPRFVLHGSGPALEEAAAQRLLRHLEVLLASAPTTDALPVSALRILDDTERHRLLVECNDTAVPYPERCLHELVADQAEKTPRSVAVVCGEEELTFADLNTRANRLAQHLVALGVGPETLVGISVERSAEMLVGLLGIMKAGGAYVPVDPAYPAERQAFMLQNSQAPVIVTQERLLAGLPLDGLRVVCLDRDWPVIEQLPAESPHIETTPEQLAYVIYTSGSTGQPKGVQIPHRALVNFLETMRRVPGLSADDVLVAVTTLSFDIAGLELYLPLLVGARVVVAPGPIVSDPRALAQLLADSRATIMQATPTTWRMLLDSGWRPDAGLRALCGGEPLPVALADRLVGLGVELWNMYGPTETTIWSTCARITTQGETLTIGRPIANTTIYILDKHLEPVPVGVAGELWIGGDGLARGYRGREDLTRERFIAHPFDPGPGRRIYRTGDLARYRADGQIEFLGRIDTQVKVRGFRIELGEIETTLTRHPGVSEAVVIARGSSGEAELAAYVIPKGAPVAALELRAHAGRTLPAYMVPSTVSSLDAFPMTPNGKVDRKALPEPIRERSAERELVAPRTALERQLAAIWERELEISPIGVTDDFFELGVTSIVAATLFAAIEHELGNHLPLGAIFRAPTIEKLAAMLEAGAGESRWTSLIPIQPEGTQPPIFCVHGGAGTILHLAALARRLGGDQPFYGLQSRGLYGGATPLKSVEEMAAHYLSEMREVHRGGPWRLAGYCFGTIVAFELAQRLLAAGEEVQLLVMFNGPSPEWIRRWGWYGNQPAWRARHAMPPRPTVEQRRAVRRRRRANAVLALLSRIPGAVRHPWKIVNSLLWYTRMPRARLQLAFGRPLPEWLREQFFLELHQKAERAYTPRPYDGEIITFYGQGLYEDPALGWRELAMGGITSFGVPGEHDNNRQAMMEPAVEFVAERMSDRITRLNSPVAALPGAGGGDRTRAGSQ